jgi:hypothetical protein
MRNEKARGKTLQGFIPKQNFDHLLPPKISTGLFIDPLWRPQENISMIYTHN